MSLARYLRNKCGASGIPLAIVMLACVPAASPAAEGAQEYWASLTPTQKVIATDIGAAAFITAWGFGTWDYGSTDWHTQNEGWFGADTKEGGADKAGHLYSAYALGRGLTALFRDYGYDRDKAVFAGTASSLGAMTLMEIGDGYSPYGLAPEDEAMNLAGAGIAWLLETHPSLDRKLALRAEYRVNRNAPGDVITDYERWRYYLTIKLDGFDAMPKPLRWIELHAGYFARGYADANPSNNRRATFVGVGLSLTRLARESGWTRTGTLLNYFQPPDTVLREDAVRR